jgi:uncharacterized protein
MRIGLISDTHVPEAGRELWPQVYDAFLGIKPEGPKVDLILHAGDMHTVDVLEWLAERVGVPVLGCRGNGDDGGGGRPIQPEHPGLKENQVFEFEGLKIGLTHDFALPEWPPYRTIDRMMERYFGGPVNVVVHGHTHVADIRVHKGVLCVNSGSPVYPRNLERRLGTVAFLEIERGRIHPWIYQLV